jgi:hypothetical protein
MAQWNDIPRGGLVETIEAKLYARYGQFSDTYLTKMLRGAQPPKHVFAMAARFKSEKPWEKPDAPRVPKKPKDDWMSKIEAVPVPSVPAGVKTISAPAPAAAKGGSWWDAIPSLPLPTSGPPVEAVAVVSEKQPEPGSVEWWKQKTEGRSVHKEAEWVVGVDDDEIPF